MEMQRGIASGREWTVRLVAQCATPPTQQFAGWLPVSRCVVLTEVAPNLISKAKARKNTI
jgi:hypothetical protein